MEAQHIHHTHGRQGGTEEIGPLGQAGTNEQSPVGASLDGKLRRRRDLLGDEMLRTGNEVVEDVLLLIHGTCLVPSLAILSAAAEIGDG